LQGEDYGNAAGEASGGGSDFSVGMSHQGAACATLWVGASSFDKPGERRHGRIFTPQFS
jgi:hypothetical protein